jgi:hypothetical protein
MLRRLTVALSEPDHERLVQLAACERREPKAQAAILLAEAVERAIRRAERREAVTTAPRDAR